MLHEGTKLALPSAVHNHLFSPRTLNDSLLFFLIQVQEGQTRPSPCLYGSELDSVGLFGKQHSDTVLSKMTLVQESLLPPSQQTCPLLLLLKCFQFWNREGGIGKLFAGSQTACNTQHRELACGFPGFVCFPISRRKKMALCPALWTASV